LEIRDEGIFVNGKHEVQPGLAAGIRYVPGVSLPSLPVVPWPYKISPGCYFVVGDNSTNAFDSRFWGELSGQSILGKVENK
jgi:signal peptidase I